MSRLKMLEELALYTNTKCHLIGEKIDLIGVGKYTEENNFINPVKYLKLNEIDWALDIIYCSLMKGGGEEMMCGHIFTNELDQI